MGVRVHPFAAAEPGLQTAPSKPESLQLPAFWADVTSENGSEKETWSPRREARAAAGPEQQALLEAKQLPPAELTHLQRKARYQSKGWQAFRELFRLYCHMLLPVLIVSLWMFGMFAFISYMVPKVFCKNTVISSEGTSKGFRPCVYNSGGEKANYMTNTLIKILWLLFWTLQQAWLVGFSCLMGYAMFPRSFTFRHWVCICLPIATVVLHMAIRSPLQHLGLDAAIYIILPAGIAIIAAISVAFACASYSRDKVNVPRWVLLMLAAGGVVVIYFIIIPRIVTARATAQQLLLTRLIIHPFIWGLITMMFTHTARHIGWVPNMMQTTLYIWPYMYNSLYGRFLLLQLGGTGNVLVINLLISLVSIVGKLASRSSLGMLMKFMYGLRTSEALQTSHAMTQIRLAETFAHIISEHAGILAASAVFSFGSVASERGVPPDHFIIWKNAGVQIGTALVADFVAMAIDWKFHSIDYFSHWVRDMRRFIAFMLVIITVGGARLNIELLLLFCPSFNPKTGVLLEYCDTPSLFSTL